MTEDTEFSGMTRVEFQSGLSRVPTVKRTKIGRGIMFVFLWVPRRVHSCCSMGKSEKMILTVDGRGKGRHQNNHKIWQTYR